MKQVIAIFFAFALCVGFVHAQSNNPNALIGRAHAAVGQCLGQAHQQFDAPFNEDVTVVGSCFAGGFLLRVTFSKVIFGPPCIPSEENPCHPPLPILQVIATVDFDCEGNIIASQCFVE